MPTSDTSEGGLEALIVRRLTGSRPGHATPEGAQGEDRVPYGGAGYVEGDPKDYDRDHALDTAKLLDFLRATQPKVVEQFDLEHDGPERLKFLNRLQGEVARRGIVDVLRNGIGHGPLESIDLFYGTPSPGNTDRRRAQRGQRLQRHPAGPLLERRDPPLARPRPLHQRPAGLHLRAQEQPHEAEHARRRRAVQARPSPPRAAVPVRPLPRPLRRGR